MTDRLGRDEMGARTPDEIVERTEAYVRGAIGADSSGHDWWHAARVRSLALHIAREEGADKRVVELAALLHDVADEKVTGDPDSAPAAARAWLTSLGVAAPVVDAAAAIVAAVSFHGAGVPDVPTSREGRCVRDADRLDALGAIGIARAFAYGGHAGRPLHDPAGRPFLAGSREEYRAHAGSTVDHFAEKLLLLADRMETAAGRRIAVRRDAFMREFLERFLREWSGEE